MAGNGPSRSTGARPPGRSGDGGDGGAGGGGDAGGCQAIVKLFGTMTMTSFQQIFHQTGSTRWSTLSLVPERAVAGVLIFLD